MRTICQVLLPLRLALVIAIVAICTANCMAESVAPPANPVKPNRSFAEIVQSNFARWDLNHDGRFETDELDQLVNQRDIHGEAAAALATIKRRQRMAMAAKVENYAVTEEQLTSSQADTGPARELDSAQGETKPFKFESSFQKNMKALSRLSHELYAGREPNFEKMRQGAIGNCFFFSVVGNLAAHQPDRIRRMITRGQGDNYIVHFGDGVSADVTVPTDIEILVNNSSYSIEDGIWLTLLEKAVGQRVRHRVAAYKQSDEETDAIAMGGSTKTIIGLFSGHDIDVIPLRDPVQLQKHLTELRRVLPEALHAHRLVAVRMGKSPPKANAKVPKLGYNHAYAVFDFDPASDQITLWNPWGNDFTPKGTPGVEHGFETKHGIFRLPLTTLHEQFSSVAVESARKIEPIKPSATSKAR